RWVEIASAGYRVAEYRPPEFLVDVHTADAPRFSGDSVSATVEARYLFGAPMGRAAVRWTLLRTPLGPWEIEIPNTAGFQLGEAGQWWEDLADENAGSRAVAAGTDTLDAAGHLSLRLPLGETEKGRAARATVQATVTDVNRQTVTATASVKMHPAAFYLGAKAEGTEWFWKAGTPVAVSVIAVRPDGIRVPGVRVTGVVERREWHQVRRERDGFSELVGEWVTDTVARCTLATAAQPVACRFTPPVGGSYNVRFTASDDHGRPVAASFYRWARGEGWVPWSDETQFKMDVIPDRTRYSVGDTATVMFASPFTGAEAWVTVEREGLIEQRRLTVTSGSMTLRFPITEAYAPNVYVSIVVARGRSAPPGPLDDPGRPTIRVGYAQLRVTPERKRLAVELAPAQQEYRPGDSARVAIRVRDAAGKPERSEVTLWAVDEGVLALTGYTTPDPIDLIYQPRGLGLRLASTLSSVAPQVPEGEKGGRSPGGGGGGNGSDVLRSRFQTTAFFLGSVITDADGRATGVARLPDNLTTFRVMAVAVTAGDRYGSGHSPLLVTRPLLARPALPRFVREGDRFSAGVVVNSRLGGTPTVNVTATARGAILRGDARQRATLEAGRGREVRFDFAQPAGARLDSATFRFDVTSGREADAVQLALPLRPAFHPRSYTIAGTVADTTAARFTLPAGIDPERSRLTLSFGTSPLVLIRNAYERLRVYPYYCTEQVVSAAQPLIALYRMRGTPGADAVALGRLRPDIVRAVEMISRRQRADGGIGFWSPTDWTSPWLSAYAGAVLVDAKAAGVPVSDSVLARLGRYLQTSLAAQRGAHGPLQAWYESDSVPLSDRVAVLHYLARAGRRERAVENELVRRAPQLAWEDRVLLASVLARWNDMAGARRLLEPAWASVRVEGRTAVLPAASRRSFYFYSPIRPGAYLLSATLAVAPDHPLVGPLVELL
ncbi:MAG: alpha-2-macroglobulin family protein, partial [Gemmatimonadota bacterium]